MDAVCRACGTQCDKSLTGFPATQGGCSGSCLKRKLDDAKGFVRSGREIFFFDKTGAMVVLTDVGTEILRRHLNYSPGKQTLRSVLEADFRDRVMTVSIVLGEVHCTTLDGEIHRYSLHPEMQTLGHMRKECQQLAARRNRRGLHIANDWNAYNYEQFEEWYGKEKGELHWETSWPCSRENLRLVSPYATELLESQDSDDLQAILDAEAEKVDNEKSRNNIDWDMLMHALPESDAAACHILASNLGDSLGSLTCSLPGDPREQGSPHASSVGHPSRHSASTVTSWISAAGNRCYLASVLFKVGSDFVRADSLEEGMYVQGLYRNVRVEKVKSFFEESHLIEFDVGEGTPPLTVTEDHRMVTELGLATSKTCLAKELNEGDGLCCSSGCQTIQRKVLKTETIMIVAVTFKPDEPVKAFDSVPSDNTIGNTPAILSKGQKRIRRGGMSRSSQAFDNESIPETEDSFQHLGDL